MSISQFERAVQLVDPHISDEELRRYVNWVFEHEKLLITINKEETSSKTNEDMKQMQTRDFEEIVFRLEGCSCFMH